MRTRLSIPQLLAALGLSLALTATGCDGSTPSADPAPTSSIPTDSVPPRDSTTPAGPELEPCDLVPGPIVIGGVLGRVTGGFAGIDESTFVPAACAADPIPVVGVDWEAVEVVETETDCDDCADAMSGATSEPVAVEGELVPAGEIDLAPGEILFAGDLVLVVTHIQPRESGEGAGGPRSVGGGRLDHGVDEPHAPDPVVGIREVQRQRVGDLT